MKLSFPFVAACVLAVGASSLACAQTTVPGDPLTGNGTVSRTLLTYSTLMATTQPSAMVNDSAYAVPTGAAPPIDNFQGTLTLAAGSTSNAKYTVYYEVAADDSYYSGYQHYLPPFSFQYVQNGSYLIPVTPGFNITGNSYWNVLLGTGRAWTETSDNGYTRASIPFALVEYDENCVHHGEMTFLFSNTKSPAISNVEYQIDMDGCAYWTFDLYGNIGGTYTPSTVSNALALQNAEAAEITNRIPVKPITALATDYPTSGFTPANITAEYQYPYDIETYGVYFNGINYVGGCTTRAIGLASATNASVYAFCSEMRFPSYSVAKTAFANMALMKLGQDYGSSIYSSLIKTYVPSTYVNMGGTWTNVTFDETSDMATGNYTSSSYEVDEDSTSMTSSVLDALAYTTKIGNSFKIWSNKTTPETTWVYHTSDAFILTSAMQYYLRSQTTSSNDLSTYLNTNVYIPLNLSAAFMNVLRTDNVATSGSTTTAGYPIGSYGLFLNQDDMVKIANFMNTGTGQISGTQTIDATRLQDTLFRSSQSGLVVPDSGLYPNSYYNSAPVANTNHYNNDIWEKTFTPTEFTNSVYTSYPSLACSFNVTYMSGYGGNTIELLPNGAIFYIFSDGGEFYEDIPVLEINKLAPMCPASNTTVGVSGVTFSSSTVTPSTASIVLTNPNAYTVSLSVPTIAGTNASLFSLNNYCSQIAANSTCTLNLTYTPTQLGTFTATLTIPTNDSYVIGTTVTNSATSTVTLTGAALTAPTITWATPAPIVYGTALSGTQLDASTSTPGSFAYTPTSGTVLAAGSQTLSTLFTPTSNTYSTATQIVMLTVTQATPTISWTPSTLQLYTGSSLGASVLNATSATGGTITYTATPQGGSASTVSSSTVLSAGTYTLTATLTPSDPTDYTTASSSVPFTVVKQSVFIVNAGGNTTSTYSNGTNQTTSVNGGGLGAAVDATGNVWSINANGSGVSVFTDAGAFSVSYSGAGINSATALAIDGNNITWITNGNGSVSALTNAGAAVLSTPIDPASGTHAPASISVDTAGSLWISTPGSNSITEVIGAAAPISTPTVSQVINSTPGTKP